MYTKTSLDQDAVIKALQQQISDFQSRTSDLASIKKELAAVSKESARLAAENKKLADSLTSAQGESKALSSKLAAARSAQPETKNVPGSAVKARTTGVVLPGTVEAAKEATLAKQKVDFYSDLTDLVVLGVKRSEDEEDVYDCLQTGRNGSKSHSPRAFQLRITNILTPLLCSTAFPPHSSLQRYILRRRRIHLPAFASRTKRQGAFGSTARLSHRRDLLPEGASAQIL